MNDRLFEHQDPSISEFDSVIGNVNEMDDGGDLSMSEGRDVEEDPDDNISIAEQYRARMAPISEPNVLRGVVSSMASALRLKIYVTDTSSIAYNQTHTNQPSGASAACVP